MNRRVLTVAGVVAVLSVSGLAAAVAGHWLGPDVDRGADFCEIADGLVRQPANTFSNLGFVVAGLLIAARVSDRSRLGVRLGASYAVVVVLLGPASAAMHATESVAGGHLDMASMYLVGGFAAAYAVMRATGRGIEQFALIFSIALAVGALAELGGRSVPVVMSWGNLWFALLLLTTLVLEIRMSPRTQIDRRWAWAAGGSLMIAFVIWNLSKNGGPLCDPHSWLQGHAIWHLLCAVAAYCLFRLHESETASVKTRPAVA